MITAHNKLGVKRYQPYSQLVKMRHADGDS